jgi:glycosyltransferase involved in cell wall biosynthesis
VHNETSSNVTVSIIVPLYNAEKYIMKCVDSILEQTRTDFECFLVDDCSQDSCAVICDEYAAKDKRIRVIHKPQNEGVPQARKTGLGMANGEYILFVDSDDWLENTMLEELYKKAKSENYDVVYCDYYFEMPEGIKIIRHHIENVNKAILIKNVACMIGDSALWFKLVKRKIYQNIFFPQEWFSEDRLIFLQILYYAETITQVKKPLYHYVYNQKSISYDAEKQAHRITDNYLNYLLLIKFLKEKYSDLNYFEPELSRCINSIKLSRLETSKTRNNPLLKGLYPESKFFGFLIKRWINQGMHLIKAIIKAWRQR